MRARTVPILLALALAGPGCGSNDVSRQASPPAARGDAKDSLFRTVNLQKALGVVRRHVGAGVTLNSFRLEAGALNTQIGGGAGESVVVSNRFKLTSVPTPGVALAGASVALAQIDPGAPERIAAQVASITGVGLRGVDYFLIAADPSGGRPSWVVYLRRGRGAYGADLAGSHVKALATTAGATPTPTAPATTTPTTPTAPTSVPTPSNPATTPSKGQVQRQLQCITNAKGNSTKIAACLKR